MPPATKREMISINDHERSGLFESVKDFDKKQTNPKDTELLEFYTAKNYKDFLAKAVNFGKNIVICGKTTFMKSLIDFIPIQERIITIEDVEETKFYGHKIFVQLFYPSEAKSGDFLNSATLLKSCLRMEPDRILLAELRGLKLMILSMFYLANTDEA